MTMSPVAASRTSARAWVSRFLPLIVSRSVILPCVECKMKILPRDMEFEMRPVRCPSCFNWSRVRHEVIGRKVACPGCGTPFTAESEAEPVPRRVANPTVAPRPVPPPLARRVQPDTRHDSVHDSHEHGLTLIIALMMPPLVIPLGWMIAVWLGFDPVFSFAVPVALALAVGGLVFGIAFAHGWSQTLKIFLAVQLIFLGFTTGIALFLIPKEVGEKIRNKLKPRPEEWHTYVPPNNAFQIKVPCIMSPSANRLAGWDMEAFQAAHRGDGVVFEIAHGTPPAAIAGAKVLDSSWFDNAREAILADRDGTVKKEIDVKYKKSSGRDFLVNMSDGVTNRVVRVLRINKRAYFLSVEGPFVTNDASFVKEFFDSFVANPK